MFQQSQICGGTAVLLRRHWHSGADRRLDRGKHPRPSTRLGLTSVSETPSSPRTVPLGLRRPQLLLLLPVVRQLPLLLQTPSLQRLQEVPATELRCVRRYHSWFYCLIVGLMNRLLPVTTAVVFGDPHFVTFDGVRYSFNGKGEYTLMTSAKTQLTIQGRTEPVNSE